MENINVFKRYETKYVLSPEQKSAILGEIKKRCRPDPHGDSTVRNIYFDTENYLLIRNSIEKPVYKEKFRIRAYKTADDDTEVFAEIKKKYRSVVYKRRVSVSWKRAKEFIENGTPLSDSQIGREIEYFFKLFGTLRPVMFISYDRVAFYEGEFKITFDENIRYRECDLSLGKEPDGKRILTDGFTVMELKTPEVIPLWMIRLLSENRIYKTSFSKYGEAYKSMIRGE